jgi:hypothetical protein
VPPEWRPRALELVLQPALGQPLAGAQIEGENHLPKLIMDQQRL